MSQIDWNDFQKVEIRVGTIIDVKGFCEARKPAYKLKVDFGQEICVKKSSAQVTDLYTKEDIVSLKTDGPQASPYPELIQ